MPDWLEPTCLLFPFAAWMFLGVGLPWALALLPRRWWRDRVTVLALSMALGPLGLTAIMFVLGTWGRITLGGTLAGSAALAALGALMARRNRYLPTPLSSSKTEKEGAEAAALQAGEWLLLGGIMLLVLINVVVTAFWPFIAYDTQWVFGYNARIFLLEGRIPDRIGYYPQLVPLGYTYLQQAWDLLRDPAINDHAARVIVPWLNLAAILMAYVLGRQAFGTRRAGLLSAGAWALYPHVAAWSGAGDLEIPLTLYVTGAAAFFLPAWRTGQARFAVISGLLLGGALWTKPTGGALALGMALAVAGGLVAARGRLAAWWPRLRIALIAALACAPLGSLWYLRNLALGHPAVTFPARYWHDFAQRSGQEFGWPLLLAVLVAGAIWTDPHGNVHEGRRERLAILRSPRSLALMLLLALALLLIATLPSALDPDRLRSADDGWAWVRGDVSAARRLNTLEWALIAVGAALIGWAGRDRWRALPRDQRETVLLLWALLLPYGVVWFRSFSYHYRLSFAIVPLIGVQVAALIDGWLWDWLAAHRIGRAVGAALILVVTGVAAAAGAQHTIKHRDLPDDRAKYDSGNPALMVVAHMLEDYAAQHGQPVVSIPGEDRLPFFFPTWDIRTSREHLPTRLEDLEGVDVFVASSVWVFLTQRADLWPNSLMAETEVAAEYHRLNVPGWDGQPWPTTLEPIPLHPDGSVPIDDGNFRFSAFTLHPEARAAPMRPAGLREDEVIIGGFAQFVGHDVVGLDWQRGERMPLSLYWRPTGQAPAPLDYSIFVHLLDEQGTLLARWDGPPLAGKYPTRFWRPGESLLDYRLLPIPADLPPGPARLRIGIYEPISGERLPVTLDGVPAGDGLVINTRIVIR